MKKLCSGLVAQTYVLLFCWNMSLFSFDFFGKEGLCLTEGKHVNKRWFAVMKRNHLLPVQPKLLESKRFQSQMELNFLSIVVILIQIKKVRKTEPFLKIYICIKIYLFHTVKFPFYSKAVIIKIIPFAFIPFCIGWLLQNCKIKANFNRYINTWKYLIYR